MLQGATKAKTLKIMEQSIRTAEVLDQVSFKVSDWKKNSQAVLNRFKQEGWWAFSLIVRSSAAKEDGANASMAGQFDSVGDVQGEVAVKAAIEKVIASYGDSHAEDEVLVQPYLKGVRMSGVAFSREQSTGSPYIVINYDSTSGATDSITSGRTNEVRTHYVYKKAYQNLSPDIARVVELITEVESVMKTDSVDIEFAFTSDNRLFLLQARPLISHAKDTGIEKALENSLKEIHNKLELVNQVHPYLHGKRTILGVMPDWNPAEIIGVRPRALALSLYCEIITDAIWAYQRDNYGYKNLRSFPLLLKLGGLPYIDVRVSFNSFIPADVDAELSEKLANYYLDRLASAPNYHDKVEFEVVFSCYTFDLPERLSALKSYGFTDKEIGTFKEKLRFLTNRIIHGERGLWKKDIQKTDKLKERQELIGKSTLDPVSKMYWLLEDCKRYGTLPFAGLARAGFIAVQILKSLEAAKVLSQTDIEKFMAGLNTVSTQMGTDRAQLSREDFLAKYGHLRPGTYDILSPRYDEAPERYFDWSSSSQEVHKGEAFTLSLQQMRQISSLLTEHQMEYDVLGLFDFLKAAIEGREYAKFVFSKSLSDVLKLLKSYGAAQGFKVEDIAHLDISVLKSLYGASGNATEILFASIEEGKKTHKLAEKIHLPSLIVSPEDVYSFEQLRYQPNFITLKTASGKVTQVSLSHTDKRLLNSSILFIPSADPGYDWIFSHGIAGFVTMYGGVNSHMAIRAAELGVPAVIGSGESLYTKWSRATQIELDCINRQVRVLS